jgi:hypothetical protein
MSDEVKQTCGSCGHFDLEDPCCLVIVEEGGPGVRTTWEPKNIGVSGFKGKEDYAEFRQRPKPEDACHFSDRSRWMLRRSDQGTDPL